MSNSGGRRQRRRSAVETSLALAALLRVVHAISINGTVPAAIAATSSLATSPSRSPHRPPWDGNKTAERVDVCVLNACEAYVRMRDDLANAVRPINDKLRGGDGSGSAVDRGAMLEARLQRLDRRLRSVEQPGEYLHRVFRFFARISTKP